MSTNKLYVGNFPWSTKEEELKGLFGAHGTIQSAKIITDKETGESRGFAFIEFSSPEEAKTAMTALEGYDVGGRALKVSEAREREKRPARN